MSLDFISSVAVKSLEGFKAEERYMMYFKNTTDYLVENGPRGQWQSQQDLAGERRQGLSCNGDGEKWLDSGQNMDFYYVTNDDTSASTRTMCEVLFIE